MSEQVPNIRPEYLARELIQHTAPGTLDTNDAQLIAAGNLQALPDLVPALADGDITRYGVVDAADVVPGLQEPVGPVTLSSLQLKHGDMAPLGGAPAASDGLFTLGARESLRLRRWGRSASDLRDV